MSLQIPDTVTDQTITPEWLNAKLGINTIEHIDIKPGGEKHGFTDAVYRIHLRHCEADKTARSVGDQQDTVIMKVIDASPSHRVMFKPLHRREVLFYHEIAPLLNLDSIPRCYHAHFDEQTLGGTILLEDAGKPIHKGGLQKDGGFETASAAQAERTMAELGRLHGTSMALSAKLPKDLPRPLERSVDEIRAAFPAFARTWRPLLGDEVMLRYERALDAYEKEWLGRKETFVQGLVHGDYRLGNVIMCAEDGEQEINSSSNGPGQQAGELEEFDNGRAFDQELKASLAWRFLVGTEPGRDQQQTSLTQSSNGPRPGVVISELVGGSSTAHADGNNPNGTASVNGTGKQHGHDTTNLKFKHVDWQTVSRGPVLFDVAYFLAMSVSTETRRASEFGLVHAWYAACRETAGPHHFPANLNIARCVRELGAALHAVLLVSVTRLDRFQAPEVPMRAVAGKLRAVAEMAVDWGCFD